MPHGPKMARVVGALILAGTLVVGGGTAALGATTATSKWSTALVAGPASLNATFTSLVAASPTSAWAFATNYAAPSKPTAWVLRAGRWTQQAFPGVSGEIIGGASSSSPRNVWAFTSNGRALRWNGTKWSGVANFESIHDGLVLGPRDVWIFGRPHGQPAGAWHFNGVLWHRFGPLVGDGASATPSGDLWVFGKSSVWHWAGTSWIATSLASLLPADSTLCSSRITGILATSSTSVWASATGGCQDFQGPLVLLHFNGSYWSRLFVSQNLGAPSAIASDGTGGVWMSISTGSPGVSSIARYDDGILSTVPLPFSSRRIGLVGVSTAPGTGTSFAFGSLRVPSPYKGTYFYRPVLLEETS
jgi:hypothetical protein